VGKVIDAGTMIGERFGRLTVIMREAGAGRSRWRCRCDCGALATVRGGSLRRGHTRSCGCYFAQRASESSRKHGHASDKAGHSREYVAWASMRGRCLTPTNTSWPSYGGKGIRVCARWDTFDAFLADMGPKPSTAHSLRRMDSSRDFEPGNCAWMLRGETA